MVFNKRRLESTVTMNIVATCQHRSTFYFGILFCCVLVVDQIIPERQMLYDLAVAYSKSMN